MLKSMYEKLFMCRRVYFPCFNYVGFILRQVLPISIHRQSRIRLFVTPWTVAHQDPLSMEFSRQEYWNGLPFPSPYKMEKKITNISRFTLAPQTKRNVNFLKL